jgi:hypothetical protein
LALGKEIFADKIFAERPLPSAALGKAFAECLAGFAECPQHSAKRASEDASSSIEQQCTAAPASTRSMRRQTGATKSTTVDGVEIPLDSETTTMVNDSAQHSRTRIYCFGSGKPIINLYIE